MGASMLSRLTHGALGGDDGAEREADRGTRAQRWIEGSIAAWERDDRITPAQAAALHQQIEEPSVLAVLPHFGVHLAIGAVLRFPFGSIARATYTLLNLLLATARLLVRNIDRRQWRQARSIHSPLVILIAAMPGIGTFAYLAARPVRTHHLLLRVGLDAVLLKLPWRVYERTGLRWVIARPKAADAAIATVRRPSHELEVRLWAQDIVLVLGCIVALLAAADLFSQVAVALGLIDASAVPWETVTRWLDLNAEASFGTWYAALSLAALAALLGTIAYVSRSEGTPFAWHWLILSMLPLAFSLDEVAKIHDPGGQTAVSTRSQFGLSGPLLYAGGLAGLALAIGVAFLFRHFIASLPRMTRRLYILAAALYAGGEAGIEFFSGWYLDSMGDTFVFKTITTVEETAGMLGILIAIAATLDYIQTTFSDIRIELSGRRAINEEMATMAPIPAGAPPVVIETVARPDGAAGRPSAAAGP